MWLSEQLEVRRKKNPAYSLRAFARSLNLPAASLSQIMLGKRPLTLKTAMRIADRFDLSPNERQAFLSSVVWQGASNDSPQDAKSYTELEAETFAIISDWYHYAILSLGEIKPNFCDAKWIAKQLGITQVQARGALDRLFKLGFIKKVGPRGYTQCAPPLDIQCASKLMALRKYHRQNLSLAEKALDDEPIPLRDFNSMTMAIDPDKIPLAKEAIRKFRDTIATILETGDKRRVYTLAIQLFPISKKHQEKE